MKWSSESISRDALDGDNTELLWSDLPFPFIFLSLRITTYSSVHCEHGRSENYFLHLPSVWFGGRIERVFLYFCIIFRSNIEQPSILLNSHRSIWRNMGILIKFTHSFLRNGDETTLVVPVFTHRS